MNGTLVQIIALVGIIAAIAIAAAWLWPTAEDTRPTANRAEGRFPLNGPRPIDRRRP